MISIEDKAEVLFKLYRKGDWGGKHTPLRGLYHKMVGISLKELDKVIKELVNENLVFLKKSTREIHISLNPHQKSKIRQIILNVLGIDPEMLK